MLIKIYRHHSISRMFLKTLPTVFLSRSYAAGFKPFYDVCFHHSDNIAVIDKSGGHRYRDILYSSYLIAKKIETVFPSHIDTCERISFLCSNDSTYLSIMLACWLTGNIAVPLCSNHPSSLWEYFISNSQSKLVIAADQFVDPLQNIVSKLNTFVIPADCFLRSATQGEYLELKASKYFNWGSELMDRSALIIYTSGSTGLPKGVVLTHGILHAQVSSIVQAWEMSEKDVVLNALPLHHVHAILYALLSPLSVGGSVVIPLKFQTAEVWKHFLNPEYKNAGVNFFTAVPTMYVKLLHEFAAGSEHKAYAKKSCLKNIRVMASGSASLPEPVFQQWENITGHYILERYGMSEIGMALSNPLNGPRVPGTVGLPPPGVEVKIKEITDSSSLEPLTILEGDDTKINVSPQCEGKAGELLIRGPNVFKEYWNNKKATVESFVDNGWFLTGDTACYESGSFKILGRTSVDIIKSGGFKISALQVESCLLLHPDILECAVLGVPDDEWGERVAALIFSKDGKHIPSAELKSWCQKHIPKYAVPTIVKYVDALPRNVLGKVNKKELKALYF